jgi:hypothetical protein
MTYIPKNNLDKEIQDYLVRNDSTLLKNNDELKKFKQEMKNEIAKLHQAHPRCKQIKLDIWSFSGNKSSMRCGSVTGDFFRVNHEMNSKTLKE